jgi:glycosyltransferase involved in cell wall biosynthesis
VIIARDYAGWTLDVDAHALANICQWLGLRVVDGAWMPVTDEQAVFHVDQFVLLNTPDWKRHRVGIAYYHGIPNTGYPEFDKVFENFCRLHERLSAVQVSNREMQGVLLSSGIDASKLHLIPIGFRDDWFRPPTAAERARIRRELNFPDSALVIGSFQKDGVGWGAGMEPKMIKGPDVFLAAVKQLHAEIPDVHVLLTGPARGYVRHGLEQAGIPYRHRMLRSYREMARMYHALDAYIVASRQEGGPKAVLESMATCVPIISTRVGQATDLIQHGENGYLVDIGDADGLAHWTAVVLRDTEVRARMISSGLRTAAGNNYRAQMPQWRRFMESLLAK